PSPSLSSTSPRPPATSPLSLHDALPICFPMPSDGALLLCSDGLTDLIASAEIRAGVERYAPDYEAAIHALIEAANSAGGKDNITDRKSTRLNSSHEWISYAVFCLKKKKI